MKKFLVLTLLILPVLLCSGCTPIRKILHAVLADNATPPPAVSLTPAPTEPAVPDETEVPATAEPEVEPEPEIEPEPEPEPEVVPEPEIEPEPAGVTYELMLADMPVDPVDFGSETFAPGHFTRAYMYDGTVYLQLGRFPDIVDEASALARVSELTGVAADTFAAAEFDHSSGFPALRLNYTRGGNEDTAMCIDLLIFAPDGVHWLHTSTPVDWFGDYGEAVAIFLSESELAKAAG